MVDKNLYSVKTGDGIKIDFKAIDLNKINMRILNGENGLVTRQMKRGGEQLVKRVRGQMDRTGLKQESGDLRKSIRVMGTTRDLLSGVSITVGSDLDYARFQNDGTVDPIYPKQYRDPNGTLVMVLGGSRWRAGKVAGPKIYAHKVKGITGKKFFEKALAESSVWDFARRSF